jgi:hypothetical protein
MSYSMDGRKDGMPNMQKENSGTVNIVDNFY